jgi:hypothetical protein
LNWRHCGDWTGARAEYAWTLPPRADKAIQHNLGLFASQNLLPPINPFVGRINDWVEQHLSESWKLDMDGFAEGKRRAYAVRELPGEEHAGLGAGVTWTVFVGLALGVGTGRWRRWFSDPLSRNPRTLHIVAGLAAFGAFFVKSAIQTNGRILAPFYVWLWPTLVGLSCPRWLDRPPGRWVQRLLVFTAFAVVVLSPSRPLWPAETLLNAFSPSPGSALERASTVYRIYRQRAEALAPLRDLVPDGEPVLGFITGNEAETSLWKPYGRRRVVHVSPKDSRPKLDRLGIRWIVVDLSRFQTGDTPPLDVWLTQIQGKQVVRETLQLLASRPPQDYAVIQLSPAVIPGKPDSAP